MEKRLNSPWRRGLTSGETWDQMQRELAMLENSIAIMRSLQAALTAEIQALLDQRSRLSRESPLEGLKWRGGHWR